MRQTVLSVHNFYQQPGGEDRVFATEAAVLEQAGHRVIRYEDHNDRIGNGVATGFAATWNGASYKALRALARLNRPDIAHFHNTFPLISPSSYYAVRGLGMPVVQKLSNFRLMCPGGILLRDGKPCEECVQHRSFRPAIVHKCYRDSRPATAAVAGMLLAHRFARTWQRMVDVYVVLSEFARRKFIEGGLPQDRIVVKPNCIAPDPGVGEGRGGYALFVGRLSEEKGIRTMVDAWRRLPDIPLVVAGDGPLNNTAWPPGVKWLGLQSRERVIELMKDAKALIFPSVCYECAPLTILEASACGLPAIASRIGSVPEFVRHGHNGILFRPDDAEDLALQVRWAFGHPQELVAMRIAARREFEEKYTAERNYKMLLEIYELALENSRRRRLAGVIGPVHRDERTAPFSEGLE